jgi:methyl-accepting chemotaxis protein
MKNIITISTTIILVLTLKVQANQNQQPAEPKSRYTAVQAPEGTQSPLYRRIAKQQTSEPNQANLEPEPAEKSRQRMDSIKMITFQLKTGELISGKLISEDRNQVTVEQPEQSNIIVSVYGKRDIDIKTLHTNSVLEYRYYTDLAEYFYSKTWDFKDDPDDFIQAIRCYEKARQLLLKTQEQDDEKIAQITEKIKKLEADRSVWTREVESRAKLKELELEATFGTRLAELEDKFGTHTQNINKSMEQLDKTIADIQDNQRKLEESISSIDKNTSQQLKILSSQVETNRRLINRMNYFWELYPLERRE